MSFPLFSKTACVFWLHSPFPFSEMEKTAFILRITFETREHAFNAYLLLQFHLYLSGGGT